MFHSSEGNHGYLSLVTYHFIFMKETALRFRTNDANFFQDSAYLYVCTRKHVLSLDRVIRLADLQPFFVDDSELKFSMQYQSNVKYTREFKNK